MYLRELLVKNNGPIRDLHLELTFTEADRPIPHVIVGRNGSGKTNLLSIVADALMQGASAAFTDVLTVRGMGTSYFRIVGGSVVTYGEDQGMSILRFSDTDGPLFYHENFGDFTKEQAAELLPQSLQAGASWHGTKSSKEFNIDNEKATSTYNDGVYAYFPASRSENPHWFNQDSIVEDEFDVRPQYTTRLGRPLYIERGLDAFGQWLMGVITESRMDVLTVKYEHDGEDKEHVSVTMDTSRFMATQNPLLCANWILQAIIDDPGARFVWTDRRNPRKIGVESGGKKLALGLNSLSGGQATMLAAFGTILRYADAAGKGPSEIEGIVVIDELDAHMHIELQLKALPKLIEFFPSIQFIISSHSPFFALGMERQLTANGVRVLELPSGTPVIAEAYVEFQKALDAFQDTKAFTDLVKTEVESGKTPLILLAGETDLKYFRSASLALGYDELWNMFDWIGAPGRTGGGSFTGDSSLNQTAQLLKANPNLTARKIALVYDCDAKKVEETFDSVSIISIEEIPDAYCGRGIENLLPNEVFTEEMYEQKEYPTGYGRPKIIPELRKMHLCDSLCKPDPDPDVFRNFEPILKRLRETVGTTVEQESGTPSGLDEHKTPLL